MQRKVLSRVESEEELLGWGALGPFLPARFSSFPLPEVQSAPGHGLGSDLIQPVNLSSGHSFYPRSTSFLVATQGDSHF